MRSNRWQHNNKLTKTLPITFAIGQLSIIIKQSSVEKTGQQSFSAVSWTHANIKTRTDWPALASPSQLSLDFFFS